MEKRLVISILETSQRQLQECEIKNRLFHLKNSRPLPDRGAT